MLRAKERNLVTRVQKNILVAFKLQESNHKDALFVEGKESPMAKK